MDELAKVYGPVGLGLITVGLPFLFQLLKQMFKLQDDKMLALSVLSTYVVVIIFYIAVSLRDNPSPELWEILLMIVGMILYPLFVWFGTQGIYSKFIKDTPANQQMRDAALMNEFRKS